MTKKQLMLKLSAYKFVIAIICLLVVGGGMYAAKAYQSYSDSPKVVVEGDYIEAVSSGAEQNLGAVGSPDVYSYLKVHGRFLQGGGMVADSATSTQTADTLTAINMWTYSGMDYTQVGVDVSLTLPASSTLSYLGSGECIDWRFRNLSNAASSTTFVAGAGIDLLENENGDVVIEGGNEARLTLCRELDTDVTVYVDEYIAAD